MLASLTGFTFRVSIALIIVVLERREALMQPKWKKKKMHSQHLGIEAYVILQFLSAENAFPTVALVSCAV